MYVIGLTLIGSDIESESHALAPLLGLAAYDVRMRITGILPRVIYQSPDKEEMLRVLSAIRARGNGAIGFDTDSIAHDDDVVKVHRFSLDGAALYANGPGSPRLAFADLSVVIVLSARTDVFRTTKEKDTDAIGYRPPPRAEKDHFAHEHVVDYCAYLFQRPREDGALGRPWLLHERDTQYLALGPLLRPTRRENFTTTITLLRERAPECQFDNRFLTARVPTQELIAITGHTAAETGAAPRGVEVIANITAQWLLRARGPYR